MPSSGPSSRSRIAGAIPTTGRRSAASGGVRRRRSRVTPEIIKLVKRKSRCARRCCQQRTNPRHDRAGEGTRLQPDPRRRAGSLDHAERFEESQRADDHHAAQLGGPRPAKRAHDRQFDRKSGKLQQPGVPFAVSPLGTSVDLNGLPGRDLTSIMLEAAFSRPRRGRARRTLLAPHHRPREDAGPRKRVGGIEEGKDADLIILNGPPLDYRSIVEKALVGGRFTTTATASGFIRTCRIGKTVAARRSGLAMSRQTLCRSGGQSPAALQARVPIRRFRRAVVKGAEVHVSPSPHVHRPSPTHAPAIGRTAQPAIHFTPDRTPSPAALPRIFSDLGQRHPMPTLACARPDRSAPLNMPPARVLDVDDDADDPAARDHADHQPDQHQDDHDGDARRSTAGLLRPFLLPSLAIFCELMGCPRTDAAASPN